MVSKKNHDSLTKQTMSQPLTKEELKKMFHDYAKMRVSIAKDEKYTGKRALVHRRMANSILTYAKEYAMAFSPQPSTPNPPQ